MNDPQTGTALDGTALSFAEKVSHLSAGYGNSQAAVRFLDTKATAIIAIVPIAIGGAAAVFKWLQDSWQWRLMIDVAGLWLPAVFVGLLLCSTIMVMIKGWSCVNQAFHALSPRDTGKTLPSPLFPYVPASSPGTTPSEGETLSKRLDLYLSDTAKQRDVLECYRRQVSRMGEIVQEKMTHLKAGIESLRWLFCWIAISVSLMLIAAAVSACLVGWTHSQASTRSAAPPVPTSAQAKTEVGTSGVSATATATALGGGTVEALATATAVASSASSEAPKTDRDPAPVMVNATRPATSAPTSRP